MTLEQKITNDLKAGQATLHNLSKNISENERYVLATLRRMEKEGKVWTMENKHGETVYKLTYTFKIESN
jgi:DNA-binding transcriptional regulator PaaX